MKALIMLLVLGLFALAQGHVYINGKLHSFGQKIITLEVLGSKRIYNLDRGVRVIKHIIAGGAIYEEPARLSDVKPGNSITIKVEDGLVKEIVLEVYK